MDKYIHSFTESLQNHLRGANEEESEWLKDQLTTLANVVSSRQTNANDSQKRQPSEGLLCSHTCTSSSVNVLTPSSCSQYDHKIMGVGGVRHRIVSRVSHNSIVSDPNKAKHFAAKYSRVHHSTTVTVAPPKEIQSKSSKRKLFERATDGSRKRNQSIATSTPISSSGTPLPIMRRFRNPPPLKYVEIKLTKIDISRFPHPSPVPRPFTVIQNEGNSSDTSGFEDGSTAQKEQSAYPTTNDAFDNTSDLEVSSPSLLANKDGFESRNGVPSQVHDQDRIRFGDGSENGPGDIDFDPRSSGINKLPCSSFDVSDQSEINVVDVIECASPITSRNRVTLDSSTDNLDIRTKNEGNGLGNGEQSDENESEENENVSEENENESRENENESGENENESGENESEENESESEENRMQFVEESENGSENLVVECENENQSEEEDWTKRKDEFLLGNKKQSAHESSNISDEFWMVVDEDVGHDVPKPCKPSVAHAIKLPLKYQCCGCGKVIYRSVDLICANYRLEVIICEVCFKSMTKGTFTVEDGHEVYCSVCGDGGDLMLCDTCEKSICQDCVKRFIGEVALENVLNDHDSKWSCFSCDPSPIHSYQLEFHLYQEAMEEEEKRGRLRRPVNFKEKEVPPLKNRRKRKRRAFSEDSDSSIPVIKKRVADNTGDGTIYTDNEDNGDDDDYMVVGDSTSDGSVTGRHTESISDSGESSFNASGRGLKGGGSVLAGIDLLCGAKSKSTVNADYKIPVNKAKGCGKKGGMKGGSSDKSKRRGKPRTSTSSTDSDELDLENDETHDKSRIASGDSDQVELLDDDEGWGKSRTISTSSSDGDLFNDERHADEGYGNEERGCQSSIDSSEDKDEKTRKSGSGNEGRGNKSSTDSNKHKDGETRKSSSSDESDHLGIDVSEPVEGCDQMGVANTEVGVVDSDDSDTEVDSGQIETDDHTTGNEDHTIEADDHTTGNEDETEESKPMMTLRASNISFNRKISPLGLLMDEDVSSSEIDSDDVSLSDSDFMDDLKRQRKTRKGRAPDPPSSPSHNDGSSTCSNEVVSGSTSCASGSTGDGVKKRKRLSLKSRKSWQLSQADYGTETVTKDGDRKELNRISSETSANEEATPTDGNTAETKRKKKKKTSQYNGVDRYRDEEKTSSTRKTKKPKTPAFISSDESDSQPLSKKKKHRDLFSSDEEDSNNRLKHLMSSSAEDDDLFTSNDVHVAAMDGSTVEFHLNPISSDEDSDFDVSLLKKQKKRTVRLASLTSNTSSTSNSIAINDGNSSDDFEESKRYQATHGSIIKKAIRLRKRRRMGRKFQSDNETTSESSTSDEKTPTNSPLKDEGSDSDVQVKTPVKRKNIRKLLTQSKLTSETREAQKAEKERIERLKQRNKSLGEGTSDSGTGQRIVLEEDPADKAVKLEVRRELVPKVLPHQIKGIRFLYNSCCEDLEKLGSQPGSGAILAHCMGLGKTLQIIGFVDALLLNQDVTNISKVLVLSPVNTLLNWLDEWNKWVPVSLRQYRVCVLTDKTKNARLNNLERWYHMGGVMIIGYTMFRNLTLNKSFKKQRDQASALRCLCDPGADIVVCDEGHVLRSEKSNLSIAVNKVKTMRRVVLTGTPLQNNLMEYYTMCSFVKPNLLGTVKEFKNQFENPIKNGQHSDSLPSDVRRMKQRAHILHQLLKGCVDRRDYRILVEDLPPKHEYVVGIRMTSVQDQLIVRYLEKSSGYHAASDLFSTFANLLKVWNHPRVLELDQERKDEKQERKLLDNFINDDSDSLDGFVVGSSGSTSSTDLEIIHVERSNGGLSHQPGSKEEKKPIDNATSERSPSPSWYQDLLPDDCSKLISLSGKMLFLMELVREVEKVGEKILVFSQSLLVLDMIEEMLHLPESGRMIEGIHYFRLDGSTKAQDRRSLMRKFNRTDSSRLRLFLISTKAGSLGINLTGANRVVIFDACWNPTHDLQSIFRTYRFGQKKPVFVYRLVAKGTMEEKIYDRQVTKQSLSMRVVDEKQIGRHFSFSQLQELFVYTAPPPPSDTPPDTPYDTPESDIIFCNILDKLRPQCIVGYHTHDSLLEHIYDEELSEEEQKLAWENYNMQKEMDSREYNMALQMQQNTAVIQNPNMRTDLPGQIGVGMSLPGQSGTGISLPGQSGTGISFPGASGTGASLLGPGGVGLSAQGTSSGMTSLAANNSNSASYLGVVSHIKYAISLARQVKGLLALRNQLKDKVSDPSNVSIRRRYVTTGTTLENRMAALNNSTMPYIVNFSRNPQLRSAISPLDLRNMDKLISQFYDLKKEITELANVPAPDHRELMAMFTAGQLSTHLLQHPI